MFSYFLAEDLSQSSQKSFKTRSYSSLLWKSKGWTLFSDFLLCSFERPVKKHCKFFQLDWILFCISARPSKEQYIDYKKIFFPLFTWLSKCQKKFSEVCSSIRISNWNRTVCVELQNRASLRFSTKVTKRHSLFEMMVTPLAILLYIKEDLSIEK